MKDYPINSLSFSISGVDTSRPDVTAEELRKNLRNTIAKMDYAEAEAKVIAAMTAANAAGIFAGLTVVVNKFLPDDVIIVGEKTYQAMLKLAPYEVGDKK